MLESPIRIFIGSADRSIIEQRVLEWSIRTRTRREVDIYILNGTRGEVHGPKGGVIENVLDGRLTQVATATPFTFFRYAIPELCNFSGRAIYLDADQLVLDDIALLWATPLNGAGAAMCAAYRKGRWATSVMLIDCQRFPLDLPDILANVDEGILTLEDLNYFTERFCEIYPGKITALSPIWNSLDYYDRNTKLIHFTNLNMQPWRDTMHPAEELWVEHLQGAYRADYLTRTVMQAAIEREHYRPDLVKLAENGLRLGTSERLKRRLGAVVTNAKFMTPRQYLYNLRVKIQRI